MTITLRGRSLCVLLSAVVCLSGALPAFGADPLHAFSQYATTSAAKTNAPQDETAAVFGSGGKDRVGVIIEFNAAPLIESRRTQDLRVASQSLDALTDQLSRDLARIESNAKGRVASQAAGEKMLRFTYKVTFAGASATVRRDSIAAIRALPYVRRVHREQKMEAYLARSVPHIGVPPVWAQYGKKGKGIVVAIIDTGINYNHWALGEGFGPGHKVVGGYDFANDDADPMDDYGHGTHVAGIVAANHKSLTGVAPEATLLAYKVLDQNGGGFTSTILAGVERAIDPNNDGDPSDHADVVNMSLGGPLEPDDPVIAAVERGIAAGTVFSLAAGNAGDVGTLGTPALAPSAITVAASDLTDRIATFSSGGPTVVEGSLKPEISAPGVKIVSAMLNNRTLEASGTSMAAPHIAGVAALLLEAHPDWTPQDVKAALVATTKPIFGRDQVNGDVVTYAGAGRVDALAAINATIFPSPVAATFGIVRLKDQPTTETRTITLTNRSASSETLTLQPPVLPAGATLTVSPETVTIAPHATAQIQLTVTVAANALPNDSDVLFSGVLTFTGTKAPMRLPWAIVKADIIEVTLAGTEDYEIYISKATRPAPVFATGPRTVAAFVPRMGESDVLVVFSNAEGKNLRMVLRERQPLSGFTPITVAPEDAIYTIRIEGVDERGVRLDQLAPEAANTLWHRFTIPSGELIMVYYPEGERSLRVSPFKETRFQTYEKVDWGSDHYFAAYRHVRKIKQDETLSINATDWVSQKIRPTCPTECAAVISTVTGTVFGSPWYELPVEDFTLHITPKVDPAYDYRAYLILTQKNYSYDRDGNPWTYISNALRNNGGRFETSPFGDISKADYYPPDRNEPLVLGDGPVMLRVAAGKYMIGIEPYGAAGEAHGGLSSRELEVNVERLDGGELAGLYPFTPFIYDFRVKPGLHRMTATDEYFIGTQKGRVTHTSVYDTTATTDGPPTLTWFRVENGYGQATWNVAARSASRVLFAGRQSVMGQGSWMVQHARLDAAAGKAWWRAHGTTEWLPLNVTNTGEDYGHKSSFPGSPGTMYAAQLTPALATEGAVDLKFSIENLIGGRTEVVYEPAFFVGAPGAPRRRAMR